MKINIFIILSLIVLIFTACDNKNDLPTNTRAENSSLQNMSQYNYHISAENKKADLNKKYAPFGVTAIYEGTAFDFNKDGIDDHIYAFSLYNQFQLTVIDGADNTYLFDETIMSAFDESSCRIEIYTNADNSYAIKAVGWNIYSAESELTETIQIFCEKENLLLEAVYDKETEQFLHAYEKYTYDEYTAKQNEILDEYSFECVIEWSEV